MISYDRVFVIEQEDNQKFNRAMLFNVGYVEAMKLSFVGQVLLLALLNLSKCSKKFVF